MSGILNKIAKKVDDHFKGSTPSQVVRKTAMVIGGVYALKRGYDYVREEGVTDLIFRALQATPGLKGVVAAETKKMEDKIAGMLPTVTRGETVYARLPDKGVDMKKLLKTLERFHDVEYGMYKNGKVSGQVYHGGKELQHFVGRVYTLFALTNPLHPDVFPFVRKMEAETIRMCINMYHGGSECCGAMSSGGTESILLACLAYRERGRKRGITRPEIVACVTVHAAFDKACHYFGIKLVHVPAGNDYRMDMAAAARAMGKNTVALVGSAPSYAQGVIDPIQALAELALKHDVGLHVDCCLGGFLIPFMADAGYPLKEKFDFRVRGVSSISCDTHKYGFAPKGTSVVMFSSKALRSCMYFVAPNWTGGIYATPTLAGSRSGGVIAAAWAAMVTLGYDGYVRATKQIVAAAKRIEDGVRAMGPSLQVLGTPDTSVVCFGSRELNVYMVNGAMSEKGWNLNALQKPACVHICVTLMNSTTTEQFLRDLRNAVEDVKRNPGKWKKCDSVAIYGTAGSAPKTAKSGLVTKFLDTLYTVDKEVERKEEAAVGGAAGDGVGLD